MITRAQTRVLKPKKSRDKHFMYCTLSVYSCFQSARFPSIVNNRPVLCVMRFAIYPFFSLWKIYPIYSTEVHTIHEICARTHLAFWYMILGKATMWQQPNARVSIRAIHNARYRERLSVTSVHTNIGWKRSHFTPAIIRIKQTEADKFPFIFVYH